MRYILSTLLLLIPFLAQAQPYQQIVNYGNQFKRGKFDLSLHVPVSTGITLPSSIQTEGAVRYNSATEKMEIWNGTMWKSPDGSSVTNSDFIYNSNHVITTDQLFDAMTGDSVATEQGNIVIDSNGIEIASVSATRGNDSYVRFFINSGSGFSFLSEVPFKTEDPCLIVKPDGTYILLAEDKEDVLFRNVNRYTSSDLITWVDEGDAWDIGTVGQWDAGDVSSPTIIDITSDTIFVAYEGRNPPGGAENGGMIGLVYSTDWGETWTKHSGNPIITSYQWLGTASATFRWAYHCVPDDVVKIDGKYYMTLHGLSRVNGFVTAIAVSDDRINWRDAKGGPIGKDGYNGKDIMFRRMPNGDILPTFFNPGSTAVMTGKWAVGTTFNDQTWFGTSPVRYIYTNTDSLNIIDSANLSGFTIDPKSMMIRNWRTDQNNSMFFKTGVGNDTSLTIHPGGKISIGSGLLNNSAALSVVGSGGIHIFAGAGSTASDLAFFSGVPGNSVQHTTLRANTNEVLLIINRSNNNTHLKINKSDGFMIFGQDIAATTALDRLHVRDGNILVGNTLTGSSGAVQGSRLSTIINQSGTAGYSAFGVYVTESATGSGTKALMEGTVGVTTMFRMLSNGEGQFTGRVSGSNFRFTTTTTPSATADVQGSTGDMRYDDNYIYIKTSAGWKRSALSTF